MALAGSRASGGQGAGSTQAKARPKLSPSSNNTPQSRHPDKPGPQKRRRHQHQPIAAGKQPIGPVPLGSVWHQQGDQAGETQHQGGFSACRQPLQGQQGRQGWPASPRAHGQQKESQRQGAQGAQAIGDHHHAPSPPARQAGAHQGQGDDFGQLNHDRHGGEIDQVLLPLEQPQPHPVQARLGAEVGDQLAAPEPPERRGRPPGWPIRARDAGIAASGSGQGRGAATGDHGLGLTVQPS
jgi:hypothetical protein